MKAEMTTLNAIWLFVEIIYIISNCEFPKKLEQSDHSQNLIFLGEKCEIENLSFPQKKESQ